MTCIVSKAELDRSTHRYLVGTEKLVFSGQINRGFLIMPHRELTRTIFLAKKKLNQLTRNFFSLLKYKERTLGTCIIKHVSIRIISSTNTSTHLADQHRKIKMRTKHAKKQQESGAALDHTNKKRY